MHETDLRDDACGSGAADRHPVLDALPCHIVRVAYGDRDSFDLLQLPQSLLLLADLIQDSRK